MDCVEVAPAYDHAELTSNAAATCLVLSVRAGAQNACAWSLNMLSRSLLNSDTQLNQRSYYEASVQRPPALAPLQGSVQADVLVVGGGFAGLSAALELVQRGLSVVLPEADRIGAGASGRNGGQAIVGYASGQGPFENQLGGTDAQRAWDLSVQA